MDPSQVIGVRPTFRGEHGERGGPVDDLVVSKGGFRARELGEGRREGLGRPGQDKAVSRLYPGAAKVRLAGGDVEPASPRHDAEVVEGVMGGACLGEASDCFEDEAWAIQEVGRQRAQSGEAAFGVCFTAGGAMYCEGLAWESQDQDGAVWEVREEFE